MIGSAPHILAAMAEHEAEMISVRTEAALAAAKARGKKLGGNRKKAGDVRPYAKQGGTASGAVRREKAEARAADLAPVVEELRAAGATSFRDLTEGLNARNIPAARGGEWSAIQVSRLVSRLEEAA